ncbi:bifunctional cytochrome P450/NADPH--P450 reductase [Variovorax sp. ZT5P49]|uniref:bifunctional cytochrome P450/NADPH--P450 reductase n=1 Tax=Variovorax sp. ZT5P49 TaxID=3443733 RepID=UPI003F473CF9
MNGIVEIPQPPTRPIVGNIGSIDPSSRIQSLMRLAKTLGPFYRFRIFSRYVHVASSQELVNELCDETRFQKKIYAALREIRAFAGDGLFTADNDEPNWAKAHRLLMPAFGPLGVRGMFPRMLDIAEQMFLRWERFGPGAVIDVAENMTRLTLDTIALCAFDYRFNSFYHEEMHPFVAAMVGALDESGRRGRRPGPIAGLYVSSNRRYEANKSLLSQVAADLIAQRRQDPLRQEKEDLLNLMLNGVDPVTGETLSDENIRFQLVTFLVAGHETTSGLLSFVVYLLLRHPEVLRKAQKMVDSVVAGDSPRVEHLAQLRYLEHILMESLRLWPTAPAFAVKPIKETLLANRYRLTPDDTVLILEPMLHRDPAVWGADAEDFRPERFSPGEMEALPPNSWKPFGNGARACIGRAFAMQEAHLVLAMLLQRFDIEFHDPDYKLKIAETLTIKPEGLTIRARPRKPGVFGTRPTSLRSAPSPTPAKSPAPDGRPFIILFGGNSGTCESFARRVAADAADRGYAPILATLDDFTEKLSPQQTLIVLASSYEGRSPDNARRFVDWIGGLEADMLHGLRFAVFGCGNQQWARTYQAIPKQLDQALQKSSGGRLCKRGEGDAGGDLFGAFDAWSASLWNCLGNAEGTALPAAQSDPGIVVEIDSTARAVHLQADELRQGTVIANRELVNQQHRGARSKRHLEIALPEDMPYRAGDYLSILARNPPATVERVLRRFALARDAQLIATSASSHWEFLPLGNAISAFELLSSYVELALPATKLQIRTMATSTRCPPEQQHLQVLEASYAQEVLPKRLSALDILDRAQSCELTFSQFLTMLPPLRPRQYSISSSPRWNGAHATITVAVVDAPALSGQSHYHGVASNYLASLQAGDRMIVAVKPSQAGFHLPADPSTPLVMVCAGTGIAPFRGFIQERALLRANGQATGRALLFFGVNHPDSDYLYQDEFEAWQQAGAVEMRPVFAEAPEDGMAFVQHRIWKDRDDVEHLFRQGAQVYVCGDGKQMAPAVRSTFIDIYSVAAGVSKERAEAWADEVEHVHGRYVSDVFA